MERYHLQFGRNGNCRFLNLIAAKIPFDHFPSMHIHELHAQQPIMVHTPKQRKDIRAQTKRSRFDLNFFFFEQFVNTDCAKRNWPTMECRFIHLCVYV